MQTTKLSERRQIFFFMALYVKIRSAFFNVMNQTEDKKKNNN